MTFKIKDFKPGDIVRDEDNDIGEVVAVTRRCLYVFYENKQHWPQADWTTHQVIRVSPSKIVEIEQMTVGERAIGV